MNRPTAASGARPDGKDSHARTSPCTAQVHRCNTHAAIRLTGSTAIRSSTNPSPGLPPGKLFALQREQCGCNRFHRSHPAAAPRSPARSTRTLDPNHMPVPTPGALVVATIRDVAREAGVSIATVSRVFNQTTLVTEATAQHVRTVAARLDYWPNSAARSLITHRTHAIGVLLPDLYGEFFSEVIRGIDLAARREKYQVLVSSSRANAETIVAAVRALRGRIDGLIVMAPDADATRRDPRLRRALSRCMLLNPGASASEVGAISIANYEGRLRRGAPPHRPRPPRIAMLNGPFAATSTPRSGRAATARRSPTRALAVSPELELDGRLQRVLRFPGRRRPRAPAPAADRRVRRQRLHGHRAAERAARRGRARAAGHRAGRLRRHRHRAVPEPRAHDRARGRVRTGRARHAAAACRSRARRRPADPHRETLSTSLVVRQSCGAQADAPAAAQRRAAPGARHASPRGPPRGGTDGAQA